MNTERRARSVLVVVIVWCVILGAVAGAYKFVIAPFFAPEPIASPGQYDQTVTLALDSFSGYALFRSPAVREQLKAQRIKLDLQDDNADYAARMEALRTGKIQMAAFTIDSFILNGARLRDFPAAIVLILDETRGADAVVAYKDVVGSFQDLDAPDARFVLTPNSPSEFLARVVIAHFSLPNLPQEWCEPAAGVEAVYKSFRTAKKNERRAYVMWEPFVSRALQDGSAQVLIDSGKLRGYIVDVLVAEREFLRQHLDVASAVVEAYLRAAYSLTSKEGGLVACVAEDGGLKPEEAANVAKGIQWKNTLENYAHFGLLAPGESGGAQHIEDMIGNIADVLVKTGALAEAPVQGKANSLYYDRILRDLKGRDFHPARKLNVIQGANAPAPAGEGIRAEAALPALSEAQWQGLMAVGELRVKPIVFGRGTARLNVQSKRDLEELAKRLQSFPQYYLTVAGHASAVGDAEANLKLANDRAQAASQSLKELGVAEARIRAVAVPPSLQDSEAYTVTFEVGRVPY